jgi:hypothetical protein
VRRYRDQDQFAPSRTWALLPIARATKRQEMENSPCKNGAYRYTLAQWSQAKVDQPKIVGKNDKNLRDYYITSTHGNFRSQELGELLHPPLHADLHVV